MQQSASVVHVPEPIGMHDALQEKPVAEVGSGVQTPEQHESASEHATPVLRHGKPNVGLQRETPVAVLWHPALPPEQQFCEAPRPPHTSPSGWQLPNRSQRRRPVASGTPHLSEQQSLSLVQRSA